MSRNSDSFERVRFTYLFRDEFQHLERFEGHSSTRSITPYKNQRTTFIFDFSTFDGHRDKDILNIVFELLTLYQYTFLTNTDQSDTKLVPV